MYKSYNTDRDNRFVKEYEERISFLKGAVIHTCPLSLFCKNLECPFHYYSKQNYKQKNHHDWRYLLEKYGAFMNVFSFNGQNNVKNLSPPNWHTIEAKVIYFLINNKDRSKRIKSASDFFSLSPGKIHKIQNEYIRQSTDHLALSTSEKDKDGYRNYKKILAQCGFSIALHKKDMKYVLVKNRNTSFNEEDYNKHIINDKNKDKILYRHLINSNKATSKPIVKQSLCGFYVSDISFLS